MLEFLMRCAGMLLLSGVSAAAEMHPWAMALIPVPVALSWARGNPARSLALSAVAMAGAVPGAWLAGAPWFGWAVGAGMLVYGLSAATGICLGAALRRGTFGQCMAVAAGITFAAVAAYGIWNWHMLREAMTVFVNARIADLEQAASDSGAAKPEAMITGMKLVDAQWPYLNLGWSFGEVLVWAALAVGVCGAALRRRPVESQGMPWSNSRLGRFRDMRPPDTLVWLAILLAVLCFVDRRWPHEGLRIVAWNSAAGLSFVYWLNGVGILLYAIGALQWNPILSFVVVLLLLGVWAFPVLGVIGFFDTWWELRRRLDRIAEIRRLRGQSGGDE